MNFSFHIIVAALAMTACRPASAEERTQPGAFRTGRITVTHLLNDSVPTKINTITVGKLKSVTVQEFLKLNENQAPYSYTFTTGLPNGDVITIPNRGNRFHSKTIETMGQANPGDIITVDNIRIVENATQRSLPALIYKVVD